MAKGKKGGTGGGFGAGEGNGRKVRVLPYGQDLANQISDRLFGLSRAANREPALRVVRNKINACAAECQEIMDGIDWAAVGVKRDEVEAEEAEV